MKTPVPLPSAIRATTVSFSEAIALGATPRRLRGPDIRRPFHGVLTALPEVSLLDLCRGYASVRLPGAYFSHTTAAQLHGIPLPLHAGWPRRREIDVSVPAPARAPRRDGVRGHSVRIALGDVVELGGLPVSSPARTWCDLAAHHDLEDLVVAGDWLLRQRGGLSSPGDLRAAVARSVARRGRPALIDALNLVDARAESPQESRLRVRLHLGGVTGFHVNMPIVASAGKRYRGDIVFPAQRVVLEYQGDHHRARAAYRGDLSRRLDLQADGWTIVELGPDDIDDRALARRIRAILATAGVRDAAAAHGDPSLPDLRRAGPSRTSAPHTPAEAARAPRAVSAPGPTR